MKKRRNISMPLIILATFLLMPNSLFCLSDVMLNSNGSSTEPHHSNLSNYTMLNSNIESSGLLIADKSLCDKYEIVKDVIDNWCSKKMLDNLSVFVDVLDDISCDGNETSEALINIAGGSGNYLVMIDGNPPISEVSTGVFSTTITGGTYGITITDLDDDCMLVDNFGAGQPSPINIMAEIIEIDSCAGTILNLDISASGGTPPYQIDVNPNNSGVEIVVTDDENCSATIFVENPEIENALVISQILSFPSDPGEDNGSIDITVEGGDPPYFYEWQDDDGNTLSTDQDIEDLAPGLYIVFLSDSKGCSISSGDIEVDLSTSVSNMHAAEIKLFPNPVAEDALNIQGFVKGKLFYSVLSSNGQLISQGVISHATNQIMLGNTAAGIYYVRLTNEQGNSQMHRFIKY